MTRSTRNVESMLLSLALSVSVAGAGVSSGVILTETKLFPQTTPTARQDFGLEVAASPFAVAVATAAQPISVDVITPGGVHLYDPATGAPLGFTLLSESRMLGNAGAALDGDRLLAGLAGHSFSASLFDLGSAGAATPLEIDTPTMDIFPMDLSGDTAVVGSPAASVGFESNGAAFLIDASAPGSVAELAPPVAFDRARFGFDVATNGQIVLVSAPWDPMDQAGLDRGEVYIYDAASGTLVGSPTPPAGTEPRAFGVGLAASDRWLAIVGFVDLADAGLADQVWIYDADTLDLARVITLPVLSDRLPNQQGYRFPLDLGGDLLAVGVPRIEGRSNGAAFLYDVRTGRLLAEAVPGDGTTDTDFGYDVAVAGGSMIVGSPYDSEIDVRTGAAYLYTFTPPCSAADVDVPFGILDLADLSAFVHLFTQGNPAADLNNDNTADLGDISLLTQTFLGGCP